MKALRIISKNITPNFWCKNCRKTHNELYRVQGTSFCSECLPERYKDDVISVDQNMELVK